MMADFMLLTHGDTTRPESAEEWDAYFERLNRSGAFDGGSSMGAVRSFRLVGEPATAARLTGFMRVRAADWSQAESFIEDNPVFKAGGTVELRELPHD